MLFESILCLGRFWDGKPERFIGICKYNACRGMSPSRGPKVGNHLTEVDFW